MRPTYSGGLHNKSNFWIQLSIYSGSVSSNLNRSLWIFRLLVHTNYYEHCCHWPVGYMFSLVPFLAAVCVILTFLAYRISKESALHSNLLGTFSKKEMPPRMTKPVMILAMAQVTMTFWKRFPLIYYWDYVFWSASSKVSLYIIILLIIGLLIIKYTNHFPLIK